MNKGTIQSVLVFAGGVFLGMLAYNAYQNRTTA